MLKLLNELPLCKQRHVNRNIIIAPRRGYRPYKRYALCPALCALCSLRNALCPLLRLLAVSDEKDAIGGTQIRKNFDRFAVSVLGMSIYSNFF